MRERSMDQQQRSERIRRRLLTAAGAVDDSDQRAIVS